MITIVDQREKDQARISICGLSSEQFMRLTSLISQARKDPNPFVRSVAIELHLSAHWILDSRHPVNISLVEINWEEVFILQAASHTALSLSEDDIVSEILGGLNTAIESSLRIRTANND